MDRKMTEQEYVARLESAVADGSIFVCYQPKINHSTERMIGAEALMRWNDKEFGLQYPSDFIPVLEKHDLLHKADIAVFKMVCRLQRKLLDEGISPVPISCNMSRYDIFHKEYVDTIENIRVRYGIPVNLLHVEITESSAIGGMELVLLAIEKLHAYGYTVEMDDFGSGYSSLNVLKDLPVDMIKLDMRFFSGSLSGRGGTIISAVVRMARWLDTPVIAEGVETMSQADYMKSIGCFYIQGYLYSKPLPEDAFIEMIIKSEHEAITPAIELENLDAEKFWDPESLETLIFNNYVGGAAIFSYYQGRLEILRINNKYMAELGMNMDEQEILGIDLWKTVDLENRKCYEETLHRAIVSGKEEMCEVWRDICSKTCGMDKICIRSYIRLLGRAGEQYLFYAMVQNVTEEKTQIRDLEASEKKFFYATEHSNSFAWEYDITTKEMRPCRRCRRVLGLPEVIENYPEPLIETGFFQPDYADMYRDWHRQIAEGTKYLECDMPLTPDRVMFHISYTTEFDENGKPLKAYGSASPV